MPAVLQPSPASTPDADSSTAAPAAVDAARPPAPDSPPAACDPAAERPAAAAPADAAPLAEGMLAPAVLPTAEMDEWRRVRVLTMVLTTLDELCWRGWCSPRGAGWCAGCTCMSPDGDMLYPTCVCTRKTGVTQQQQGREGVGVCNQTGSFMDAFRDARSTCTRSSQKPPPASTAHLHTAINQ